MGEEFFKSQGLDGMDEIAIRQLAKKVVGNVIQKATEEVARQEKIKTQTKRPTTLSLDNLTPSIQIDLVPSRTPSPDEPENDSCKQQQTTNQKQKRKIRVKINEEDDIDIKKENNTNNIEKNTNNDSKNSEIKNESKNKKVCYVDKDDIKCEILKNNKALENKNQNSKLKNDISLKKESIQKDISNDQIKFDSEISSKNLKTTDKQEKIIWPELEGNELKKVASKFVKQIINDATVEVEKRQKINTVKNPGIYIEEKSKETYQPWFTRFRESLMRLMRSTCLCKSKMGPNHSNTIESIVDQV